MNPILLIPLFCSYANRIRGDGDQSGGDFLFAVAWAMCCGAMGAEPWQSLLSAALMWGAQSLKWGPIFGALGGWFEGSFDLGKKLAWINWLCEPFEKDVFKWGCAAAILRGLPYMGAFLVLGAWGAALAAPFGFFISYLLGIKFEQKVFKRDGWVLAEFVFGFTLGALLITGLA